MEYNSDVCQLFIDFEKAYDSIKVTLIKTCLDGTWSKVRIRNFLSSSLPIENILKQEDALLPLIFNFALECVIRKVQETNLGLEDMNGTHQELVYTNDVNVIGNHIRTTKRKAVVFLNACMDIGLTVNIGKT